MGRRWDDRRNALPLLLAGRPLAAQKWWWRSHTRTTESFSVRNSAFSHPPYSTNLTLFAVGYRPVHTLWLGTPKSADACAHRTQPDQTRRPSRQRRANRSSSLYARPGKRTRRLGAAACARSHEWAGLYTAARDIEMFLCSFERANTTPAGPRTTPSHHRPRKVIVCAMWLRTKPAPHSCTAHQAELKNRRRHLTYFVGRPTIGDGARSRVSFFFYVCLRAVLHVLLQKTHDVSSAVEKRRAFALSGPSLCHALLSHA